MQEEAVPPHQIDPAIPALHRAHDFEMPVERGLQPIQSIAQLEQALNGSEAQIWAAAAAVPVRTANVQRVVSAPAPARIATPTIAPVGSARAKVLQRLFGCLLDSGDLPSARLAYWRGIANARAADLIPPARLPAPVPPEIAYGVLRQNRSLSLLLPPNPSGPSLRAYPTKAHRRRLRLPSQNLRTTPRLPNPQPEAETAKGFSRKGGGLRTKAVGGRGANTFAGRCSENQREEASSEEGCRT